MVRTEVWEGGSGWVAGKLVPKDVCQHRWPMESEGHHPRAAARVPPTLRPSEGGRAGKLKTWWNG